MDTLDAIEEHVKSSVNQQSYHFWRNGSDGEITLDRNRSGFSDLLIRPKFLDKGVERLDLSVSLLNGSNQLEIPVGISPSSFHKLANPEGELATVRGCKEEGSLMIVSAWTQTPLEAIAASAGPKANLWQNIYIYKDRSKGFELVRRAEKAGFQAIVVSIDAPVLGNKRGQKANVGDTSVIDYIGQLTKRGAHFSPDTGYQYIHADPAATWQDFEDICKSTSLPVIPKGVMTAHDAHQAIVHRAQGIFVSNHGGRQLDGLPGTIEMLPEVVSEVNGKCDVYLDGGIRTGNDVFKALALGAKAVFVGRPPVFGLAYDGSNGVRKVLQILKKELGFTMAHAGCSSLKDISSQDIIHKSELTWKRSKV